VLGERRLPQPGRDEMRIGRRALLAGGTGSLVVSLARAEISTPPPGSSQRRAILDAFRPRVEAEVGAPVVFTVSVLHVSGNWAFVEATPKRPGGVDIDWKRTRFREAFEKDFMSDIVMGLLKYDGTTWTLVEYVIGPTDVFWENWLQKYRLPRQLFLSQ
jgi:hypothetical protein